MTGEALPPPALTLSLVIPVFNEGANIDRVINETTGALTQRWPGGYEILVVDDGSSDDTPSVTTAIAERHSTVRILRHARNQGLGAALKTGYSAARGDLVSFIPGDGEVAVSEVLKLHDAMGTADLIVGTRKRTAPSYRDILSWGMQTLMRLVLGFDPSGMDGLYVIRRRVLEKFKLRSSTGLVNLEIFMRCYGMRCEVRRGACTTDTRPRISGSSKVTNFKTVARTFFELFKLRIAG